jgi:hypothetical protein
VLSDHGLDSPPWLQCPFVVVCKTWGRWCHYTVPSHAWRFLFRPRKRRPRGQHGVSDKSLTRWDIRPKPEVTMEGERPCKSYLRFPAQEFVNTICLSFDAGTGVPHLRFYWPGPEPARIRIYGFPTEDPRIRFPASPDDSEENVCIYSLQHWFGHSPAVADLLFAAVVLYMSILRSPTSGYQRGRVGPPLFG